MKAKRIIITLLVVCCLVAGVAASAFADAKWYTCTVVRTGYSDDTSRVEIYLRAEGRTQMKRFFAPTDKEKEMLATALTAMSMGAKVDAKVDYQTPDTNIIVLHLLEAN